MLSNKKVKKVKNPPRNNTSVYKPPNNRYKEISIPKVNLEKDLYISIKGKSAPFSPPELRIYKTLVQVGISFIREASFKGFGCEFSPYRFDFFIPSKNIVIEYDGRHHSTKAVHINDVIKNKFCAKNKIKIVRLNKKHYPNLETYVKHLFRNN